MTSTPSQPISTMKAVILPRPPSLPGVRAMTTSSSASGAFVHQSFVPLRTYSEPSSLSTASQRMRAGSLPTSVSVRAKPEMAPFARRGRYFSFCSSVPKMTSGCGTPIDWCADSVDEIVELCEPARASARV